MITIYVYFRGKLGVRRSLHERREMTASIRDTLTCSNAVCAGWRSYKSNSGLILLIFHILFHFTLWLQMTEARLCTYVSVCRRFSGYCRRDAILPGASFSYAHFNTFPSFTKLWPGSFQEQLITTNHVYGSPQLADYQPAFGRPTRSSLWYGTQHPATIRACPFHVLIAFWAWFLSTHVTLIYLRQGFSCLITFPTLVTHFT